METSDLLEPEDLQHKVVWRCVWTAAGALCAMTHGVLLMQESPADNSAILIGVRERRYEMVMERGVYVAGKQKGTLGAY